MKNNRITVIGLGIGIALEVIGMVIGEGFLLGLGVIIGFGAVLVS